MNRGMKRHENKSAKIVTSEKCTKNDNMTRE